MKVCPQITILVIFLFAQCLDVHAAAWSTTTVHEIKTVDLSRNSVVDDDAGNPHVFYGGSHLYHGYRDASNSWVEEVVDNAPQVGRDVVAKSDKDGNYHILYTDKFTTAPYGSAHVAGVKYAFGNNASWTIESTPIPIEAVGNKTFGGDRSLGIDSSGNIHFAYITDSALYYAVKSSAGWTINELRRFWTSSTEPGDVMLVIGSDDVVHISYFNHETNLYEHAYNSNGAWSFETVNTDAGPGSDIGFMALAIDSQNAVHICYRHNNATTVAVYCSTKSQGTWTQELVDDGYVDATTQGNAGYLPSIYIDESDNIHLAYFLELGNQVEYIRYAHKENSSWSFSTYHLSSRQYARLSNLSITADGSVGLFLIDENPDDLIQSSMTLDYVEWDGSAWSRGQVASAESSGNVVGYKSDVVVDQNGFTHIVYVVDDIIKSKLYYANNLSGAWSVEELADFANSSDYAKPALALDANGFLHIAFAQDDFTSLGTYYLTNASGVWVKQNVGTEFLAVGKYAICVDSAGTVHIAYITNGSIRKLHPWQMRYANNSSGSWVETAVFEYDDKDPSSIPRFSVLDSTVEMAIDPEGYVHVVFCRLNQLIQAVQSSSGWSVNTILTPGDTTAYFFFDVSGWQYPTIAFDKNLDIYFAYVGRECDGPACYYFGMRYSKYSAGTWQHTLVDAEIYFQDYPYFEFLVPDQPEIAVSDDGAVYIAYYHAAYEHLRVAKITDGCLINSVEVDGALSLWDPTAARMYYLDSSLVIGTDGKVRIAYFDKPNSGLKYAISSAGLEIEACLREPAESQPFSLDLYNRSSDPISVTDMFLVGYPGAAIVSDTCSGDLINPNSSCTIVSQTGEPLARTISGVLYSTITDPISGKSNAVFFRLPETTASASSDTNAIDNSNSSGSSSGGGGSFTVYLSVLFIFMLWQVFRTSFSSQLKNDRYGSWYEFEISANEDGRRGQ